VRGLVSTGLEKREETTVVVEKRRDGFRVWAGLSHPT
jgi:hypothetical protein